jgi:hypothetical protein
MGAKKGEPNQEESKSDHNARQELTNVTAEYLRPTRFIREQSGSKRPRQQPDSNNPDNQAHLPLLL